MIGPPEIKRPRLTAEGAKRGDTKSERQNTTPAARVQFLESVLCSVCGIPFSRRRSRKDLTTCSQCAAWHYAISHLLEARAFLRRTR